MGLLGKIGRIVTAGTMSEDEVESLIPGIGDAQAQNAANKQNLQLDKVNRDWMERMSNSAYQRAMDDMKKAGLNPILAYQQGGASVPTTAAATVQAAPKTGLAKSGLEAYTGISDIGIKQQNANTAKAEAESTIALQTAQAAQYAAETQKTQTDNELAKEKIQSEQVRRKLDQKNIPLASVTESAASLAQKGVSTIQKVTDNVLKSTAKPSVDKKNLRYNNPWIPDFLETTKTAPSKRKKQ